MEYTSASFNQRLLAQMVDLTIIFPVFLLLDHFFESGGYGFWLICFVLYFLYSLVFESSKHRGTPGKMLLRLEIVSVSQKPYKFIHTAYRQLLKGASLALFFIGFFMVYFHPRGQALHDYLTRTRVVSKIDPRANW